MKLRASALFLAVSMMLGLAALPAAAAVDSDLGVFQGTAQVGKSGTCDNSGGAHDVTGGGIGLPVVNGAKRAQYSINAPSSVVSPIYGIGSLRLCGKLTSPLDIEYVEGTPVGASCASTKGYDGQGKATFDGLVKDRDVYLKNLGWEITVGGTFLVTADGGGSKGADSHKLVAVVQALSEGAVVGCLEKTLAGMDKSGLQPDPFTVAAAYVLVPVP
ncbi:MAG TPA: hypothetical protein VNU01_01235 [Egibacteraceae bacterium]|nr:hypothetical protein [Egibacteraceae bacterium]